MSKTLSWEDPSFVTKLNRVILKIFELTIFKFEVSSETAQMHKNLKNDLNWIVKERTKNRLTFRFFQSFSLGDFYSFVLSFVFVILATRKKKKRLSYLTLPPTYCTHETQLRCADFLRCLCAIGLVGWMVAAK